MERGIAYGEDFACRTAIKSVAPCRGDFYTDIFSVSSFVPHRGSRLSLSFSLLSALADSPSSSCSSVVPPSPRSLSLSISASVSPFLSSSVRQFISVSLFLPRAHRPVSRPRSRVARPREEREGIVCIRVHLGCSRSRKFRDYSRRTVLSLPPYRRDLPYFQTNMDMSMYT